MGSYNSWDHNASSDANKGEEEENDQFSLAMELALSSLLPMVMKAALELRVFDIIAEAGPGPGAKLSPSHIGETLAGTLVENPSAAEMLDRMLQFLASHSILTCTAVDLPSDSPALAVDRRKYGLAPVCKYFIPNKDGVSLASMLYIMQEKVFTDSGRDIPFERVQGIQLFEYLGKNPRFNEAFNRAMIDHSTFINKKILESSYKGFEQLEKLVDVGGGLGVALKLITSKYPHIKGINFDLPHVIQRAPPYPGVEHVAGDMFAIVPKGDAIFMKWILYDWSDDHCLKLLKNCHKALPDNGKIIVVEGILPVMPDTSSTTKANLYLDIQMMAQTPGGKERTEQEFFTLAIAAGFSGIRLECMVYHVWIMEFYK